MGTDPQQLRREIEQTRQELSYDADALTEKVSPGRIVDRRVSRVKGAMSNARDSIMGSASDVTDSTSGTMSGLADSTSGLADSAKHKAQGNPLAAGLIAFGAGWLVSALIPASQPEQRAASQLTDAIKEHSEPVKQELSQLAGEIKDSMQEPVQQAAQSVRDTTAEAANTVKEEGQSAASGIKDDATAAGQNVREQQQSGYPPPL